MERYRKSLRDEELRYDDWMEAFGEKEATLIEQD